MKAIGCGNILTPAAVVVSSLIKLIAKVDTPTELLGNVKSRRILRSRSCVWSVSLSVYETPMSIVAAPFEIDATERGAVNEELAFQKPSSVVSADGT